ncbi:MAG: hypothetical protein IJC67_01075 [Clostridia bacterium]|nr:hypothetical protein [Clostridia bacterium]
MNAEHALELRTGWKAEEDALLFETAGRARTEGKSLKAVFEEVASLTGRRPNSIRNYYYARIREDDERVRQLGQNAAFVPFTEEEIEQLLRTVLKEQAKGVSVRACTLAMGNGDNKLMLRYQNKYRSLVKNNPRLVKKVIEEMQMEGAEVFDPYQERRVLHKVGRPRKREETLVDAISGVVKDLDCVEGLDVTSFFESLGALAVGAAKGVDALRRLEEYRRDGDPVCELVQLRSENEELKASLHTVEQTLNKEKEQRIRLLGAFETLMGMNREFLGMTSIMKVSSLSNYIRELSHYIEACEAQLSEYVN